MSQETPSAQGTEFSGPSSLQECQELFSNAPIGIFTSTPEGRFISVNPAMARMFGYDSPEEMIESISDIAEEYYIDPSDREEFVRQMLEQGQVVNHECQVRRRDGAIIWVSRNAREVRDKNGKITHYQGFITDITERKQMEEAIENERAYLSAVIDNIGEAIVICGAEGRIVRFNEAARRLHGLPEQPIPSDQWAKHYDLYQEDGITPLPMENIPLFRALQGERVQNAEIVVAPKHSRPYYLACSGQALTDETGRITGAVVAMHDITERKHMEERLRRERDRSQRYLDTTQTMMVALDPEGRITMINRSGRELLGYAEDEILGCSWFETCLPQPEGRESVYPGFQSIMAGDLASVEYFENKIVCRDGTQRLMGWHNAFWEDDDGRVVGTLSSGEDITEHRQAEESLRESEQQFRTLFMESPVSITIHDKDNGEVLDANPKAYTSYGLASLEELKARGMFMEPPYSYTEALGSIRKAATKGPQQFEWLNRNIYGELFWEQARLIPMTINGVERVVATTVDITELKQTVEALRQSENYYRAIFETSGSAMFIMENDTTISHVNSNFEKLTGYSSQEIEGRTSWTELVHPDDLEWMKEYHYLRRQGPDMAPRQYEFRFMTRCDQWRDMSFTVDMIPGTNQSIGSGIDITERKQAEEELRKREEHLQAILQATPDPIVVYDSLGHPQYINHSFCQVFGWTFEELQGQRIPFVPEDQKEPTFAKIREIYSTGVPVTFDTKRLTKNNRLLDIRISAAIIQSASEEHYGLVVILTDITERKQMEQKLRRMSLHDALTGLYNRNFFEEQMKRLSDGRHNPLGIIVCDVNGLKFINDTLGHQSGDQVLVSVAGILRQSFRSSDIIARLGGDEFAVLLTDTDPEVVEVMLQRLRQTVLDFNSTEPEIPVSLSMGHALGEGAAVEMQALFREADSRMYREKIQRKRSSRSVILQAITQTMKARDFDTEGHCDRLQKLAISFAHSLDLAQDLVNDISLLARFHDLGKVGIPDHILFKPGPLTEEEWQQMRQHCEIGHRIASSVPDLEPIADYILKHHEYWDGSGYPLGLQGEDIPLVCRILAIVDAYDVMSSGRPYRQALTREEAISELRRFAGTQFDPELVEQFIQILEQNAL